MILGHSPPSGGELTVARRADAGRRRAGAGPDRSRSPGRQPGPRLQPSWRTCGSTRAIFPRPCREPLEPFLESLLDFVALADRAGDRIQALSGGMRRRLVIARALVNDPEMLILDDRPTVSWTRRSGTSSGRACASSGITEPPVLLTTHYMEEAERALRSAGHHRPRTHPGRGRAAPTGGGRGRAERDRGAHRTGCCSRPAGAGPACTAGSDRRCLALPHDDPGAVLAVLQRSADLEYLHRPANL